MWQPEAAMKRSGEALRLWICIGADDIWHHKPLADVRRARRAGLAGATVLHGIEGYGAHSVVHTTHLLSFIDDLPVLIMIVDSEERVRSFLPQLDDLVREGMVMLDHVEIVRYTDEKSRV
jgi:PII-like signaling protein